MADRAVRNQTAIEQYIIVEGKRESLAPYQTRVFDEALAQAFLAQRPGFVVEEKIEVGATNTVSIQQETGWIANVTGNPDLPELVNKWNDRSKANELVPNPKRVPLVLKHTMGGGQELIRISGEETSRALAPVEYTFAPFARRALPKHVADFCMARDALNSGVLRGGLSWSRAPSGFEPASPNDQAWSYSDMQVYLGLVDSGAVIGPSEPELKEWFASRRWDAIEHALSLTHNTNRTETSIMQDARTLLFKRLFFRLADPRYKLPTREEFGSVKAALPQVLAEPQALAEPEKRGPGRPPNRVAPSAFVRG